MPKPIAICIENLGARRRSSRYLRCVALPGRQPGLRLDKAGRISWEHEVTPACELWVSADSRLILYRQEGMTPVRVERAGRHLDAPCSKPVVLIDQDRVTIGRHHLCIHIHGEAQVVTAPSPLVENSWTLTRLAKAAAAATLIGATLSTGGCTPGTNTESSRTPVIDVRDNPPVPVLPSVTATPTIEVRDFPPTATPVPVTSLTLTAMASISPTIDYTSFREQAISLLIQGEWVAGQAYEEKGVQSWFNGTLLIDQNTYIFQMDGLPKGTPADGGLNFIFAHPAGEIEITYLSEINSQQPLKEFSLEDLVAKVVFRDGEEISNPFWIQVKAGDLLIFTQNVAGGANWTVYKQLS
jgi:hypothetical protein